MLKCWPSCHYFLNLTEKINVDVGPFIYLIKVMSSLSILEYAGVYSIFIHIYILFKQWIYTV